MIRSLARTYLFVYLQSLVYMMQSTEYQPAAFIKWCWRTRDFSTIMKRRTLVMTRPAQLLLAGASIAVALQVGFGLWLGWYGWHTWQIEYIVGGAIVAASYPFVVPHVLIVPLLVGRILIIAPHERRAIQQAETIFAKHPAVKIAIAGSYGKTTMKEILLTVLREGKQVAATPANKNVAIAHAAFARSLTGSEDILLIEYGEGQPGDVSRFTANTHPNMGIITGLAPAHLDRYKTVQAAGQDIYSLAEYLHHKQVYISGESPLLQSFVQTSDTLFNQHGVLDWQVTQIEISAGGTSFTMQRGKQKLKLTSKLLGRHQVAPLALAAALGLTLGLSEEQVVAGVAQTVPFEHRMQPCFLGGATIIDDTYNGNIEGVRAGLALLQELPATRRWHVTPGLVEQGGEAVKIHIQLGELIAASAPDVVVLMQNSTTAAIQQGLKQGAFAGQLKIESNPLRFYQSLEHLVAAGDVVLMQNDWTDNYA